MSWNRIIVGDCRAVLARMPERSVHMICTSPPYWGLRDYGTARWEGGSLDCDHVSMAVGMSDKNTLGPNKHLPQTNAANVGKKLFYKGTCKKCGARRVDQQLGSEESPDCLGWATGSPCGECYVCHMVAVFRGVRRVLRDDGVVFLNLGDSYSSGDRKGHGTRIGYKQQTNRGSCGKNDAVRPPTPEGLKPKDRIGVPHRVALALQADGWYWRDEIVWDKVNPMPASVTDRCSPMHEMVFMLTKKPRYFYDFKAIEELVAPDSLKRNGRKHTQGNNPDRQDAGKFCGSDENRRKRSVWSIPTKSMKEEHFAAFPPKLAETCIRAGTSLKGCCPRCGAPVRRVLERDRKATRPALDSKVKGHNGRLPNQVTGNRDPERHVTTTRTVGWEAGCDCGVEGTAPCRVLDFFSGAGTTCMVAKSLGRSWLGIELNPKYVALSLKRINGAVPRLV